VAGVGPAKFGFANGGLRCADRYDQIKRMRSSILFVERYVDYNLRS
jgi:hypothetical protein